MIAIRIFGLAILGLSVLAAAGCSPAPQHGDTGDADVIVVTSAAALTQADLTAVHLTISGAGIDPALTSNLAHVGNRWQGTVGEIPVGDARTFHGDGVDATGATIYAGDASPISIVKDQKALVALVLQQTRLPIPFVNSAPQIDSVYVSSDRIEPGGTISVRAGASDPDHDPLTFEWTSDTGSFADPTSLVTSWTAAGEGTPTLRLQVKDDKGATAAIDFIVNVQASSGEGSASIAASFNNAPSIDAMTSEQNPIVVDEPVHIALSASDLDGDAIATYEWTSSCAGDLVNQGPSATFRLAASAPSSCTFSARVTDARGGWNSGDLTVQTGPAASFDLPPIIDSTFQSSDVADSNDSIVFRAKAHDPNGGAVTYTWLASIGTFGAPTTNADGESEATWTAPRCMKTAADFALRVTDSTGNVTNHNLHVDVGTPCPLICKGDDCRACVPPPSGMLSWWSGEGTAADRTNARPGSWGQIPYYWTGVVGDQQFFFNRSNYVVTTASGLPGGASDRTVEAWVQLFQSAPGGTQGFLAGYGSFGANAQTFHLGMMPNNQLFFSNWGDALFGPVLPYLTPTHVAVTSSGSTVILYVNGVEQARRAMALGTVGGYFWIGGVPGVGLFAGAIDEVAIYDRALSANELTAITNAGFAGKCH